MNKHDRQKNRYSDFTAVEKDRNEIIPEQTPEGSYGSPIDASFKKTTPWQEGQRSASAFIYENKELHQGLERKDPGSHPTHDDKRTDYQKSYRNSSIN
ncbi:hypothetical protein LGQ02_17285 [Bacillus shivajii]|uniref:hypothetical protein n=1 Tax=Bacillus shivajii TaxID=1983719 RepID=UPI001CFB6B56|nr:hypothetical protein [Bacillus shivajii]UCZ52549.1 hypothetical protein LGQ02_17285 [Bacillus shivajii]